MKHSNRVESEQIEVFPEKHYDPMGGGGGPGWLQASRPRVALRPDLLSTRSLGNVMTNKKASSGGLKRIGEKASKVLNQGINPKGVDHGGRENQPGRILGFLTLVMPVVEAWVSIADQWTREEWLVRT
jgi:hypothetical protein